MNKDRTNYSYGVVLDKDITIDKQIEVDSINLSISTWGHKVTNSTNFYDEEEGSFALFSVTNGASLFIDSIPGYDSNTKAHNDGLINIVGNGVYIAYVVGNPSHFTISTKGNISSDKGIVYMKDGGGIDLYGGTYECTGEGELFKTEGDNTYINIKGGWYKNFDPTQYVQGGYGVTNDNGTYVVGKHTVNFISDEYSTFTPSGEVEVAGEEQIPYRIVSNKRGYYLQKILKDDDVVDTDFQNGLDYGGIKYTGSSSHINAEREVKAILVEDPTNSQEVYITNSETDTTTAPLNPEINEQTTSTNLLNSLLTPEAKQKTEEIGEDAEVYLKVVEETDQDKIEKAKQYLNQDTYSVVLDITLNLKVGKEYEESIKETPMPINIEIDVPEELKLKSVTETRKYTIIRVHGDDIETLDGYYNRETGKLSFNTDKFSTYAIAYKDVPRTLTDWDLISFRTNYGENVSSFGIYVSNLSKETFGINDEEEYQITKNGKDYIVSTQINKETNQDNLNLVNTSLNGGTLLNVVKVSNMELKVDDAQARAVTSFKDVKGYFVIPSEYIGGGYSFTVIKVTSGNVENVPYEYDEYAQGANINFEYMGEGTYALIVKKVETNNTTTNTDSVGEQTQAKEEVKKEKSNTSLSCADAMKDKNWIWSESKKACVYRVSNTSSK